MRPHLFVYILSMVFCLLQVEGGIGDMADHILGGGEPRPSFCRRQGPTFAVWIDPLVIRHDADLIAIYYLVIRGIEW